jgi:hypothetical protein
MPRSEGVPLDVLRRQPQHPYATVALHPLAESDGPALVVFDLDEPRSLRPWRTVEDDVDVAADLFGEGTIIDHRDALPGDNDLISPPVKIT